MKQVPKVEFTARTCFQHILNVGCEVLMHVDKCNIISGPPPDLDLNLDLDLALAKIKAYWIILHSGCIGAFTFSAKRHSLAARVEGPKISRIKTGLSI